MSIKRCCPALLGLFCCHPLHAETVHVLDDIVVTATRLPQRQDELAVDTSVVTRSEIERAGQATLAELLATQPGVEIVQNGGTGSVSSVFLRGANAGHTLVLVDGVRMTSATLGSARLEHIPLDLVERIEIVRGPMSHLYGSEAIGGVIQIFTRKPGGAPRAAVAAGYGSYGHTRAEASLQGHAGGLEYALAAGHDRQDGFSAKPAAYADRDGYRNDHASLRLAYDLDARHRLTARGYLSDGQSHFDDGVTPYDSRSDARVDSFGVGLESQLSEAWISTLRADRASETVTTRGYSDPFPPWFDGGAYASRIGMEQWQYGWQLDGHAGLGDLQLLLERLDQEVTGDVGYSRDRRSRDALGASWRRQEGRHRFGVSLRRDDDSQFGGKTTGAASWGIDIAQGWRADLSWGTGFKAPAFDDLYWPGAGNPDLKPESSNNREIGVRYTAPARSVAAILYRNDVSDLIQWAPDTTGDWRPANVARARLQGLSLSWQERRGAWTLRANLDLQEPENADTGTQLILRSRRHGALAAEYALGNWRFGGELVGQGRRYNDAGNSVRLAGYGLLNLGAGYALTPEWRVDGRLDNVFDREYERAAGYAAPGRSLFVTLRYAPK